MSDVEILYRKRIADLTGEQRIARTLELYSAGCDLVALRLQAEDPSLRGEKLRRRVAQVMYRNDPEIQKLLRQGEC